MYPESRGVQRHAAGLRHTAPAWAGTPPPERYCPRIEGFGAVIPPQRQHVCASCGEPVIYNRRLDDPPELRLVCTVCLVSPP